MDYRIEEVTAEDDHWPLVRERFWRAVSWMRDPDDDGDYHFFAALDGDDHLLGGAVIEVGRMRFGPLADVTVGFLEYVHVAEGSRRKGIARALIRRAADFAWTRGAQNVRSRVEYGNLASIALFEGLGWAIVPEEDPDSEEPVLEYAVVTPRPSTD
jgi:GNAT superfamily N-acetyltransferase